MGVWLVGRWGVGRLVGQVGGRQVGRWVGREGGRAAVHTAVPPPRLE